NSDAGTPKLVRRRRAECPRIEPAGCAWVGDVRIPYQVGASAPPVPERRSLNGKCQRTSGREQINSCKLPTADYSILDRIHLVAEFSSAADRQIPDGVRREDVSVVESGASPVVPGWRERSRYVPNSGCAVLGDALGIRVGQHEREATRIS